jgi:DNA-binding NarL/FixJ family response regulator
MTFPVTVLRHNGGMKDHKRAMLRDGHSRRGSVSGHTGRHLIVGRNVALNQLVGLVLRRELGEECAITADPSVLQRETDVSLLLVDDSDPDARAALLAFLTDRDPARSPQCATALFNVDPGTSNVREFVRSGVRGIFLISDPMPKLIEGIRSILSQEVWIPREILVDAAVHSRFDEGRVVRRSGLTMRELQVISLVCTGATNEQIAEELCLSPHTVKTHVYKIFKKLDVGSRVHAALWAVEYLGARLPGAPRAELPRGAEQVQLRRAVAR